MNGRQLCEERSLTGRHCVYPVSQVSFPFFSLFTVELNSSRSSFALLAIFPNLCHSLLFLVHKLLLLWLSSGSINYYMV